MGFYLSPSVNVREQDLTTSIPAIATSIGAIVGDYTFGPALKPIMISSEAELLSKFTQPTTTNNEHFLVASSFLSYSKSLYVIRAVDKTTAKNGTAGIKSDGSVDSATTADYIGNEDDVEHGVYMPAFDTDESIKFVARYPGSYGNNIGVALTDLKGFYDNILQISTVTGTFVVGETITGGTSSATGVITAVFSDGLALNTISGTFEDAETITGGTSSATTTTTSATLLMQAEILPGTKFSNVFEYLPESGQYALAITLGNNIKEKYYVSFTPGTTDANNTNIYIEDLLLQNSKYVYAFVDTSKDLSTLNTIEHTVLTDGVDGTPADTDYESGYDLFANTNDLDVNLVIEPAGATTELQQYIIDNIVDTRKDCVAILNAPKIEILGQDMTTATSNIIDYVDNTLQRSSSYAAIYPNYKYMYDRYNKTFVWTSISGDVAGIYAYTDYIDDPWYAPAGYNRGKMKNVSKLAYNPNRTNRDLLYKDGINPVIMDKEGAIVFGQKTLLRKPSAFDRVNVRRLFIIIEKSIATALKYFLFEQNTDYTRKQVVAMIQPYLRNIQGRQGLYDYYVQCDENNNTPEYIDLNELLVDLYLKPTRDIEFIQLTAIAVNTGVEFSEIVKTNV